MVVNRVNNPAKILASTICLLAAAFMSIACDPLRKNKCEWYILPYPEGNSSMEIGWVSLCVANFELGKQRCFFTAKPDFVEKIKAKPFRYSSMEFSDSIPHKIKSLKTCKPGS